MRDLDDVLGEHPDQRFTNSQTFEMTTDPSPTDEATRFTEPARTSPTAKMPGIEVANGEIEYPASAPVYTNPLSSSRTRSLNHAVFGAAPTITNNARVFKTRVSPLATWRIWIESRCFDPCSALTSAPYSMVILGSASRRLDR